MDDINKCGISGVQADKLRHGLEQRLSRVQPADPAKEPHIGLDEVFPCVASNVRAQGVPNDVKVGDVGMEAPLEETEITLRGCVKATF